MPQHTLLDTEAIALLVLLLVIGLSALAQRWRVPYPIFLVVGGLALAQFQLVPLIVLDPDLIFLVLLPPLLFSSAYRTSWPRMRANAPGIGLLALGLVGLTVVSAALISDLLMPGLGWHVGLVLGAVVSTTDAIAATAIASRMGLPQHVIDVIEGESLTNDASGLLALDIALGMLVTGHIPTAFEASWKFLYLVGAAILLGLAVGRLIHFFLQRMRETSIAVALSLAAPYLAYLAAENVHASGVLATVACGLYLGHRDEINYAPQARESHAAVWDTLTFILNGVAFILIGLQLPWILESIAPDRRQDVLLLGVLFALALMALRIFWVFPGSWLLYFIEHRILRRSDDPPSWRSTLVIGWSGMRGVLALAAAMSLPHALQNGSPFPGRDIVIVVTFIVILVTLVGQGLTLPALIRTLGFPAKPGDDSGR